MTKNTTRAVPAQFEIATRQTGEGCRPIPQDHPSAAFCTSLKTVQGETISGMGIHKSGDCDWVLTDLTSGCRIISTKTRKDARRLATALAHLYDDTGRWLDEQRALTEIGAHMRAYMQGRWLDCQPGPPPEPLPARAAGPEPDPTPPSWKSAARMTLDRRLYDALVQWLVEMRDAIYVRDLPLGLVCDRALAVPYVEAFVIMPCPDYPDSAAIVAEKMLPIFAQLESMDVDDFRAAITTKGDHSE